VADTNAHRVAVVRLDSGEIRELEIVGGDLVVGQSG
jgi:hypothetical protein